VAVQQRVVGGQFLAGADVAHGDQDDIAREPHVGLAGVVEEQHHRFVLGLLHGGQMETAGDLELRVLQPFGQGPQPAVVTR